jgi:DNA-binding MarR family transcriptional regulator
MDESEKKLLTQILKKLEAMDERLVKLEREGSESQIRVDIPPALARILKILNETNEPSGSEQVSKRAGLSRNLTSAYLTRLTDMGYAVREPNLDKNQDVRYVFRVNKSNLPDAVKRYLK